MKFNKAGIFKYLIIISSIYIYGCIPGMEEMQHTVNITGIDFTKYTAKGFLFTPESYMGQYESVGQFSAVLYPQIVKEKNRGLHPETVKGIENFKQVNVDGIEWLIERVTLDEVVDSIYSYALKLGANAVVSFKIDLVPRVNGALFYNCYEVSGFAIKKIIKKGSLSTE